MRAATPPTSPIDAFVQHCIELLSPLGRVRAKRMFGSHGLYLDEHFIAIVVREQLYLKVDASTRPQFEAAGGEPFVYSRQGEPTQLGFFTVPAEALEAPPLMAPWARLALQAALAQGRPRPRASKTRR